MLKKAFYFLSLVFIVFIAYYFSQFSKISKIDLYNQPFLEINDIAEEYVILSIQIHYNHKNYLFAYVGNENEFDNIEKISDKKILERLLYLKKRIISFQPALTELSRYKNLMLSLDSAISFMNIMDEERSSQKDDFAKHINKIFFMSMPSLDIEYYDDILQEIDGLLLGDDDLVTKFNKFLEKNKVADQNIEKIITYTMLNCRKISKKYFNIIDTEKRISINESDKKNIFLWNKNEFNIYPHNDYNTIYHYLDRSCKYYFPGYEMIFEKINNNFITKYGWIEYKIISRYSPSYLVYNGLSLNAMELFFPPKSYGLEFIQSIGEFSGSDTENVYLLVNVMLLYERLKLIQIHIANDYISKNKSEGEIRADLRKYLLLSEDEIDKKILEFDEYGEAVFAKYYARKVISDFIISKIRQNIDPWVTYEFLIHNPNEIYGINIYNQD